MRKMNPPSSILSSRAKRKKVMISIVNENPDICEYTKIERGVSLEMFEYIMPHIGSRYQVAVNKPIATC